MFDHPVMVNQKFFRTFQPLFHIYRITGLSPFTYTRKKLTYSLQWSWKIYICNCVIITILTFLGFWGIYEFLKKNAHGLIWSSFSKSNYFAIFDFGEIPMIGFCFVFSTPFKRGDMWKILNGLNKIDSVISPIDVEKDRKQTIIFACVVLSIFSLVMVFDAIVIWSAISESELGLKDYSFYLIYFVVIVCEIQYWQLVFLTGRRIAAINRNFDKNLKENEEISTDFHRHKLIIILLSCFLRLVLDWYMVFVTIINDEIGVFSLLQMVWIFLHLGRLVTILEICHICERE
ncbi:7tm 7 domain containing protein, partial [Asbolus verrucosus]